MQVKIKGNKIRVPLKSKDKYVFYKTVDQFYQKYICILMYYFDFALEQMTQEIQVNNFQRLQESAMP